ncbi:MAG: hypothetical protein O3A92_12590 [Verrucomicrobia bacterium]|nr:hypothetical protein [Verrucomicrobiota bacterium]
MKSRPLILGSAWALSLAAAYMIGHNGDRPASSPTQASSPSASAKSPRSSSGNAADTDRRASSANPGLRLVAQLPPKEAVTALALLSDPVARAQGFLALVDSLSPEEFKDVVAEFRALGITDERFSEYGILLHAWGQVDPQGALAYAIENTHGNFARQTVLASWAGYDPDAAIAFAEGNFTGEGANPLLVGVIRGLAREDLNRATDLMQGLPRSRERGEALESLLPILLAQGVDQALTWSQGITDEGLRGASQANIARHLAEADPVKGAELIMSLPDQDSKFRALDDITQSWAKQDLSAAMAFAEGLEPSLRGEGAEGIVAQLASTDPLQASQWLQSVAGEGVNLDAAIGRFIWEANSTQPALAANWIGQMTDQRDAERNYHRFLGRWIETDAAAARAWMADTQLPESIQRRFAEKQ